MGISEFKETWLSPLVKLSKIEVSSWKFIEISLTWPVFPWLLDPWQVGVIVAVILRKGSGIISVSSEFLLS